GTPDQSFGSSGMVTTNIRDGSEYINDVLIQKDGKIMVCGVARGLTSNSDFTIMRYQSNGTLDVSFGVNGLVTTDFGNTDVAASILSISDDKFIVVGYSDDKNLVLARYHNDLQSSTNDVDEKFSVNVYPTPVHSVLNISFYESGDGPVTVELKNSAGSLVKEISISNLFGNTIQLDLPENLPLGMYYLLIKNKQHQSIKKVVVY
ncbi:MAG: T9SS type A sorting domain-containing protein, partial [Saprospiraceae bacterium]|nr:T9SS type A sorting domain-containing protein [Saprospiraceae bacterium]